MKKYTIEIRRTYLPDRTIGVLALFDDAGQWVLNCKTLEPPWKNNEKNVSCIPEGTYTVETRYSDKHGHHLIIINVPGRTYILIHAGNFTANTKGCILTGKELRDIDGDGNLDVTDSKSTLKELLNALKTADKIELTIY